MIPTKIFQCWFGGERPDDIREMMISVRAMNLGWEVIVIHEDNAKDLLGLDIAYLKDKCQNWASVSNIVRLHAVYKYGGIFADADIKALKSFEPLRYYAAFSAMQDGNYTCNAFFGAEPEHPWIKFQIDRQEELMDADAAKGVYLMSMAPRDRVWTIPTHLIYPWHWDAPQEKRVPHKDSIVEHFWKGSWSKK